MRQIIDTHIHIWDFARAKYEWLEGDDSILGRSYTIGELTPQLKELDVTHGVIVQAAVNEQATEYDLEVAGKTDWISGVVGWLPLKNPDKVEKLLADDYGTNPYFKGCRHLIHDEADPKWLLQDKVLESLKILAGRGLPYDVVGVLPEHIRTVLKVAEKVPDLRMVFDHLNQPPIAERAYFGEWGELIKEAAKNPNFYGKISGLGLTAGKGMNWSADDLKPYILFALEQFGEDRCFCGGDWPVALLAGKYETAWNAYLSIFEDELTDEEQERVLFHNAVRFYNLDV